MKPKRISSRAQKVMAWVQLMVLLLSVIGNLIDPIQMVVAKENDSNVIIVPENLTNEVAGETDEVAASDAQEPLSSEELLQLSRTAMQQRYSGDWLYADFKDFGGIVDQYHTANTADNETPLMLGRDSIIYRYQFNHQGLILGGQIRSYQNAQLIQMSNGYTAKNDGPDARNKWNANVGGSAYLHSSAQVDSKINSLRSQRDSYINRLESTVRAAKTVGTKIDADTYKLSNDVYVVDTNATFPTSGISSNILNKARLLIVHVTSSTLYFPNDTVYSDKVIVYAPNATQATNYQAKNLPGSKPEVYGISGSQTTDQYDDAYFRRMNNMDSPHGTMNFTLVAPRASLVWWGGSINGRIIVQNYHQRDGAELHGYIPWPECPEPPTTPEPKPEPEVEVELEKKGDDGRLLAGAQFELQVYKNGSWQSTGKTYTTDSNGRIRLSVSETNALRKQYGNGPYRFKETKPPNGYTIKGDGLSNQFTLDQNGKVTINMVNEKEPEVEVEVEKKGDDGRLLAGAQFELQVYKNGSWQSTGKTYTTDSNGKIRLSVSETNALRNQYGNGPYRFKETKAPNGYTIKGDGLSNQFTLNQNGKVTINMVNEKEPDPEPEVEVEVEKKGDDGRLLAGAQFELQVYKNGSWQSTGKTYTTDSNGKIKLTVSETNALRKQYGNGPYRFKETKAPNGYTIKGDGLSNQFTLDRDGKVTINMVNEKEPDPEPEVEVEVEKKGDDGRLLAGAQFELQVYKNGSWQSTGKTYTTDANGKIKLSVSETNALRKQYGNGPYRFKETKAPNGYTIKGDGLSNQFTLDKNGKVTINMLNCKEPEPEGIPDIELEKRDPNGKLLEGAVFELQYKGSNRWLSTGKTYTTDRNGKIKLSAADIKELREQFGNGPYRFYEKSAPAGHAIANAYSDEFTLDKNATIIVENPKIPEVEVEKRDSRTKELLKEATFMAQYKNSDGDWIMLPITPAEFTTVNGVAKIPERIVAAMINWGSGGYSIRIREVSAPAGYPDPQRPSGPYYQEPSGNPGDQFSKEIGVDVLTAANGGRITLEFENEKEKEPEPEVEVEVEKKGDDGKLLSGAQFELQVYKNGSWQSTGKSYTTDANGKIKLSVSETDTLRKQHGNGPYRFKETKAPNGYTINGDGLSNQFTLDKNGKVTINMVNPKEPEPEIEVEKQDATTHQKIGEATFIIQAQNNNGTWQIYTDGADTDGIFTTKNGLAIIKDHGLLRSIMKNGGNYRGFRIREIKAPTGYHDPKAPDAPTYFESAGNPGDQFSVEFDYRKLAQLGMTERLCLELENELVPTYEREFYFKKVDEFSEREEGLAGAVFVLEKQNANGQFVSTGREYTTNAYGEINFNENEIRQLGTGTYRLKEIKAPNGYQLPDNVYSDSFVITDSSVFPREVKKTNRKIGNRDLTLLKIDEKTKTPLPGAVFELEYRDAYGKWYSTGFTYTTGSDGKIHIDDKEIQKWEYAGWTFDYRFKEIQAPPGYQLPENPYTDVFTVDKYGIINLELIVKENQKPAVPRKFDFKKIDADTGKGLPGAKFDLIRVGPPNKVIDTLTTDQNGMIHLTDEQIKNLGNGTYRLEEVKAPAGYEIGTSSWADFEITDEGVVPEYVEMKNKRVEGMDDYFQFRKRDADTQVGLPGAKFALYRKPNQFIKYFYTDNVGNIILSYEELQDLGAGTYYMEEVEAPAGYELPDNPRSEEFTISKSGVVPSYVIMTNKKKIPANREFTFTKIDANSGEKLKGAVFELEKEVNGKWTNTGKKYTTDANGRIQLSEADINALGTGKYRLKEVSVPSGYELPSNPYSDEFVVTKDKVEPFVVTMANSRIKDRKVSLKKVDAANSATKLPGAKFVLERKNANGSWSQVGTKTYTTDSNGEIKLTESEIAALGNGEYRFKETTPPTGYDLPTNLYTDSFKVEDYTVTPNVLTKTNAKTPVVTEKPWLEIEKRDATTGELLKEATFIIQSLRADNTWSQFIVTGATNEFTTVNGVATIKDEAVINALITYAGTANDRKYRVREVKAPTGYPDPQAPKPVGSNEAMGNPGDQFSKEFTINKDSKGRISLRVDNKKPVERTFKLKKVDADNKNTGLAGAKFVLEKKNTNGSWSQVNSTVYTTDSKGEINLTESQIKDLGNGEYRFKETAAPNGYDLPSNVYTDSFVISDQEVKPKEVTKENKATPPPPVITEKPSLEIEKRDATTGELLKEATFIIQSLRADNTWSQFIVNGASTQVTTVNGVAKITDEAVINALINYSGTANDRKYRVREVKAPAGYTNPQAPNPVGSSEAMGNPGDQFSKEFTINKDTKGRIVLRVDNKKPVERTFKLKKVDADNKNTGLAGAKFVLEKKNTNGSWSQVNSTVYTTDSKGEINLTESQIKDLGNGEYRFKETAAPNGYDLPSNVYTDSFVISDQEVKPKEVTKENKATPPPVVTEEREIVLTKVDQNGKPLPGVEFVIQALRASDKWDSEYSIQGKRGTRYVTDKNGQIIIKDQKLIKELIEDYNKRTTVHGIRFRETKAPAGYRDPQFKEGLEAKGKPGDDFSVVLDMVKLQDTGNAKLQLKLTNHLVEKEKPWLEIEKRDADTGALLKEATFIIQSLRADNTWSQFFVDGASTQVTTVNGVAKITDEAVINALINYSGTANDRKFRIREVKAPAGYTNPQAPNPVGSSEAMGNPGDQFSQEFTIDKNSTGKITLTIKNKKNSEEKNEVNLKKVSEDNLPLPGARFVWERKAGSTWVRIADFNGYVTDKNGELHFDDAFLKKYADVNATYRLREIQAPDGYLIPLKDATEEFTVINGKPSVTELKMVNKRDLIPPGTETATLKKVNANGEPLQGAEFVLMKADANGNVKQEVTWQNGRRIFTTDAKGEIKLDTSDVVWLGDGYYRFYEIKAPTGYIKPDVPEAYSELITIKNGKVTPNVVTMVNQLIDQGFTLIKVDETSHGALEGAQFRLQKKNANGTWSYANTITYKTDSRGALKITAAELKSFGEGTYRFEEVKAPAGYEIGKDPYSTEFVVDKNGKPNPTEFWMENATLPSRKIALKKTDEKGKVLPNVEFVIQVQRKNGQWDSNYDLPGQIGKPFKTNAQGLIEITNQAVINQLIKDVRDSNTDVQAIRFRESKAPAGYRDPQFNEGLEAAGKPGDDFAVTIDIDQLEAGKYSILSLSLVNKIQPPRSYTLKKVSAKDGKTALADAEFNLMKKVDGQWVPVTPVTVYKTDKNGLIVLDNDAIQKLAEGTYCFKETKAPEGYELPQNPYSQEFVITADAVKPDNFTMKNAELPELPTLRIEKVDSDTGQPLDGAVFIIQSLRSNGQWSQNKPAAAKKYEFETKNGVAVIDDVEFIKSLIKWDGTADNQKYRIREIKAPTGYKDPQAPNPLDAKELVGGVGDEFSQEFSMSDVINGVVTLKMSNTLVRDHKLKLKKVDANTGAPIKGAVFELWGYYQPSSTEGRWIKASANLFTTDENGELQLAQDTIDFLLANNYTQVKFKEVSVPEPYLLPEGDEAFTDVSKLTPTHFEPEVLTKKNQREERDEREITLTKVDENGKPIAGVEFVIQALRKNGNWDSEYNLQGKRGTRYTTDSKGQIVINDQDLINEIIADYQSGKYMTAVRFRETKAKAGYQDPQFSKGEEPQGKPGDDFSVVIDVDQLIKDSSLNLALQLTNYLDTDFDVQLEKVDENGKPLAGAKFALYGEWKGTGDWYELRSDLVTDKNGKIKVNEDYLKLVIEYGYTAVRFRELKAPDGYLMPTDVWSEVMTFSPEKGFVPSKVTKVNYKKQTNNKIRVEKRDKETGELITKETQFIIQGKGTDNFWRQIPGTPIYSTIGGTTPDGIFEIDATMMQKLVQMEKEGTYLQFRIREIKAAPGYENPNYPSSDEDNPTPPSPPTHKTEGSLKIEFIPSKVSGTLTMTAWNKKKPNLVTLKKVDASDETVGLAGAEFTVEYSKDGQNYQPVKLNSGEPNLTTDANGKVEIPVAYFDALGDGYYRLKEVKAPEGYLLPEGDDVYTEPIFVKNGRPDKTEVVKTNKRVQEPFTLKKVDAADENKFIPGAVFILQKANSKGAFTNVPGKEYTTDANGEFSLSQEELAALGDGTYRFKETQTPAGYLKPTGDDQFTDSFTIASGKAEPNVLTKSNQAFDLELQKRDKDSKDPLAGVEFILQRKVDGEWVDLPDVMYVTDAAGNFKLTNQQLLALGNGTYRFKETKQAEGYEVPDKTNQFSKNFVIKDNLVSPSVIEMTNTQRKRTLELNKISANDGKVLAGVKFILQRKDETNTWVDLADPVYVTDAKGQIHFNEAQIEELGTGVYRFKEIESLPGYEVPDKTNQFSKQFTIADNKVTPNVIDKKNKRLDRRLELVKVDEDDKELSLPGAEFIIQSYDEVTNLWSDIPDGETYRTNPNGNFFLYESDFQKLGNGTYRFKETKAPDGYDLPTGSKIYTNKFTIKDNSVSPTQLTKTNKREFGLEKVDAENAEKTLPGAEFVLERKDGKGNWTQVDDVVYQTDKEGRFNLNRATLTAIGNGTYRFKETKAPENYVLPKEEDRYTDEFTIKSGTATPNQLVKTNQAEDHAKVVFNKTDGTTGKPVVGATFELLKKEGRRWEVIDSYVTKADGLVYFEILEEGTYRIQEVKAARGYLASAEIREFTITKDHFGKLWYLNGPDRQGSEKLIELESLAQIPTDVDNYLNYNLPKIIKDHDEIASNADGVHYRITLDEFALDLTSYQTLGVYDKLDERFVGQEFQAVTYIYEKDGQEIREVLQAGKDYVAAVGQTEKGADILMWNFTPEWLMTLEEKDLLNGRIELEFVLTIDESVPSGTVIPNTADLYAKNKQGVELEVGNNDDRYPPLPKTPTVVKQISNVLLPTSPASQSNVDYLLVP